MARREFAAKVETMSRVAVASATPDAPIVYVSPSCNHCRALLDVLNRSGKGNTCRFVNIDAVQRLPTFVDRVPLLFDGTSVHTDSALFDLFQKPTAADAVAAVDPGPGLCGGFSS